MPALDIKVAAYYNNTNVPTSFNVDLSPANDEILPAFNVVYTFPCFLGDLDIPNSIFPDFETAVSHFLPDYAPVVVSTVNYQLGLSYTLGNIYKFMNKLEYDKFASKADISSLATVATSGSYNDLSDKPSTVRTSSALSLSLVGTGATGTQISATKDSMVHLCVSVSTTASVGGDAVSAVALKKCATNDATEANWTTVAVLENDQSVTLALALSSVQLIKGQLSADLPAGWYVKLVNSGSGTHTEAFISGEKTVFG